MTRSTCTAMRTDAMTTLVFDQPAEMLTMNQRLHWAKRARIVKAWRKAAAVAAWMLDDLEDRAHGPSLVSIELPVPDKRRRDPMNYTPVLKACVDGLVDSGVWVDDTPEYVTTVEPSLVLDRPRNRIVRIHILPRPNGPLFGTHHEQDTA